MYACPTCILVCYLFYPIASCSFPLVADVCWREAGVDPQWAYSRVPWPRPLRLPTARTPVLTRPTGLDLLLPGTSTGSLRCPVYKFPPVHRHLTPGTPGYPLKIGSQVSAFIVVDMSLILIKCYITV